MLGRIDGNILVLDHGMYSHHWVNFTIEWWKTNDLLVGIRYCCFYWLHQTDPLSIHYLVGCYQEVRKARTAQLWTLGRRGNPRWWSRTIPFLVHETYSEIIFGKQVYSQADTDNDNLPLSCYFLRAVHFWFTGKWGGWKVLPGMDLLLHQLLLTDILRDRDHVEAFWICTYFLDGVHQCFWFNCGHHFICVLSNWSRYEVCRTSENS